MRLGGTNVSEQVRGDFVRVEVDIALNALRARSNPRFNHKKALPLLWEYGQFGGDWLQSVWQPSGGILLMEDGSPLLTEDGHFLELEDAVEPDQPSATISSDGWTGIEARLERDEEAVERIKGHIRTLDAEVEMLGLSNHERQKVKAITEALIKLAESPEPEWKAIVELLRSPTLGALLGLAGIAQLALKIIFGIG